MAFGRKIGVQEELRDVCRPILSRTPSITHLPAKRHPGARAVYTELSSPDPIN
jgi:hypothetical protein